MPKGLTDKERHRNVSKECQALRDLVNKLKLELLQSQVEAQKVRDQLQCVIYLVRRAWQGDETASIHVSNIVGVAPPRIQKNPELAEFTVTPKVWYSLCLTLSIQHGIKNYSVAIHVILRTLVCMFNFMWKCFTKGRCTLADFLSADKKLASVR